MKFHPRTDMPKSLSKIIDWIDEQHRCAIYEWTDDSKLGDVSLSHNEIEKRTKEFSRFLENHPLIDQILIEANQRLSKLECQIYFNDPSRFHEFMVNGYLTYTELMHLKMGIPPHFFHIETVPDAYRRIQIELSPKEYVSFQRALKHDHKTRARRLKRRMKS